MKQELKKIIDAVGTIHVELAKLAVEVDRLTGENSASSTEKIEKPVAKKEKKSESVSEGATFAGYTEEQLRNEVSYTDLKKIAAELGVSAKGKRDEVVARILETSSDVSAEEPKEEKKASKPAKSKVSNIEDKKKENEDREDEFGEQADELLEENDEEDIIEILKEVGVTKITKKNLRKKVIDALAEGLLDEYLDDDDDDDDDETQESPADGGDEEGEEIDGTSYFEDYDTQGVNNPQEVDETRLSTMVDVQTKILDAIEGGKLKEKTMRKFLMDNSTEDEQGDIEEYDEDEVIAAYCELRKAMIDDDGDDMSKNADEAYYINDELFQCGHKCVEVDGELVSEVTGDRWEK